jgi:hypothetical protein
MTSHQPTQPALYTQADRQVQQMLGMPKVAASILGDPDKGFHYFPQTLQKMMTQYNTGQDHFLPYSRQSHWTILRAQQQAN